MTTVDPSTFLQRIFDAYGGKDAFFKAFDDRLQVYKSVWAQDSQAIGRVLRAHLAVEHFIGEYISLLNPKLGSLADARLSFAQKVALLDENEPHVADLKPGLERLNSIRNRIAHRLRAEVTDEDKYVFLSIRLFAAMRTEGAKRFGAAAEDQISVLEQFAHYAAMFLHAATDSQRHLWAGASAQVNTTTN